jgi:hypothetical protein
MAKKHKYGIINTHDVISNPDEAFCALNKYSGVYWQGFSASPSNWLEKKHQCGFI